MAGIVRADRFGDDGFTVRFFIANREYGSTNIYASNLLYHRSSKLPFRLKYLQSYTQNSQSLNESLNKDDVSSCGTEIRELDKCIIGLKHNIEVIFCRVWNNRNEGHNIERIKTYCLKNGRVAAFRGARIGSADYNFICGCKGTNRTIRNKSFMSCSLDYGVALKFTSMWGNKSGHIVIFTVYLSQTDDWSYAYVAEHSTYPREEEVIVRPCRQFLVSDFWTSSNVTHIALVMVW